LLDKKEPYNCGLDSCPGYRLFLLEKVRDQAAGKGPLYIDVNVNLDAVDEESLNFRDRLGLACCRLSCGEWDEFLGPEPEEDDYTYSSMRAIEDILGSAECSKYWWLFALGRTEEEWMKWYVRDRIRGNRKVTESSSIVARIKERLLSWRLWR